jgi:predicted RNA binding protein YcfA (HicA-like mRNA interferase family)
LPEGFYKAVCKEIKSLGFSYHSNAKGSHENWVGKSEIKLLVPHNLISRHRANGVLKDARSTKNFEIRETWYAQGELNPCSRRERAVS